MAGPVTALSDLALHRRLDALLPDGGPGATIGIARAGQIIAHRHAGLASIEAGTRIDTNTLFRIASVSKQFTCAAIMLLAREGRLDVCDTIGQHLPGLPAWGAAVTLDHLMRNSAGLRDMLELLRAGGVDLSHPVSADAMDAAIARSTGVNFEPGTRFLYSNTNFRLLGRVVEAVSGMPLQAFLAKYFFAPLGMTRTRHTPDVWEPVPGLATGYVPRGTGMMRAPHGFALGGEGGLVSCVEDLLIWASRMRAVAPELTAPEPFANGLPNIYHRGLEVESWRGHRVVSHGGLWPGFKTAFLTVPDAELAVVAITNNGGADAAALGHAVLEAALDLPARADAPAPDDIAGAWWMDGTSLDLFVQDGRVMVRQHGIAFPLRLGTDGLWHAERGAFRFALDWPARRVQFEAGASAAISPAMRGTMPPAMAGRWHCADAGATWTIAADGALHVAGPLVNAGPFRVEGLGPDIARAVMPGVLYDPWWDVRLDGAAALVVNGARARGLRFTRVA